MTHDSDDSSGTIVRSAVERLRKLRYVHVRQYVVRRGDEVMSVDGVTDLVTGSADLQLAISGMTMGDGWTLLAVRPPDGYVRMPTGDWSQLPRLLPNAFSAASNVALLLFLQSDAAVSHRAASAEEWVFLVHVDIEAALALAADDVRDAMKEFVDAGRGNDKELWIKVWLDEAGVLSAMQLQGPRKPVSRTEFSKADVPIVWTPVG